MHRVFTAPLVCFNEFRNETEADDEGKKWKSLTSNKVRSTCAWKWHSKPFWKLCTGERKHSTVSVDFYQQMYIIAFTRATWMIRLTKSARSAIGPLHRLCDNVLHHYHQQQQQQQSHTRAAPSMASNQFATERMSTCLKIHGCVCAL